MSGPTSWTANALLGNIGLSQAFSPKHTSKGPGLNAGALGRASSGSAGGGFVGSGSAVIEPAVEAAEDLSGSLLVEGDVHASASARSRSGSESRGVIRE